MKQILLLALLVSCNSSQAQQPRCSQHLPQPKPQNTGKPVIGHDLDTIHKRGYITIAAYQNFPPFSWLEHNEAKGIDIDIGRFIAAKLGVKPRFKLVAAGDNLETDLYNNIWHGPIVSGSVSNMMMRTPYDPDFACRIQQVVFTAQYSRETLAVAYRKNSYPNNPALPGHFRKKTVAVENASLADLYLSSLLAGQIIPNMRRYHSIKQSMQALEQGAVSAAMGSLSQLEYNRTSTDIAIHQPPTPGLHINTWDVGIAVHSRYRPLAYAIDDAILSGLKSGKIAEIYKQYGLKLLLPKR